MPADATEITPTTTPQTAREAPTAQTASERGVPKKITNAQTVCNEKNEKGKLCNGHLKQLRTGGEEAQLHLRGDDVLFKCQTCGTLYMGPPLGHVRDPEKQSRFVQKELTAILQAAGGTLPEFKKNEAGAFVLANEPAEHGHAPAKPVATAATKPADAPSASTPVNETPEEKKARLIAEAKARKAATTREDMPDAPSATSPPAGGRTTPTAHSTSGTDSSAAADAHREAAEAQAATGQASAVPLSPAAATASPAAGAETVADLAPEASTELTPGAPKDSSRLTEAIVSTEENKKSE